MEWQRNTQPNCEACQEIYAGKGKEPPCETCKPELGEENEDALLIYSLCQTQVIVGMNGVIDINIGTVDRMLDRYQVEDTVDCLEKVIGVFRHFQSQAEGD